MNNDFMRHSKNNYPKNYAPPIISIINKILEKNDLNQFKLFISENNSFIKTGLLNFILFYIKDIKESNSNNNNIKRINIPSYISILLSFGLDPNIIIDEFSSKIFAKPADNMNLNYHRGKSLLMYACENSYYSLVKELCESNHKKQADINYCDKNGRNCLFYLKGLDEDSNIIEYLVNKGIEINRRDNEENSVLNHLIINTNKVKLIYDFINLASPIFTIKNIQGKNSLDLINEKWIVRKNQYHLANYDDIKKLINLIKNKLSFKSHTSQSNINTKYQDNNILNNMNNIHNNNLIKLSSLTTMNTEGDINNNNISKKNNNNDLYIKVPRLSLIIDTEFNDNDSNTSTTKKIDNYMQMNKNKKYLLNLLKSAEYKIKENSKYIQDEINKKNNKLKEYQNLLEETKYKSIKSKEDWEKKFEIINNNINKIKHKIDQKKQILYAENKNAIITIPKDTTFMHKYEMTPTPNIKKDIIYSQLNVDLIDFMNYVHGENSKLESTLKKLNSIIEKSVLESLGEDYILHMYGSRATNLCLPWSDIDYVISYTINKYIDPLKILYEYLYTIPERFFVDMKYISGASVPVLKIYTTNEYHKISLDISMENQEHHGEECVKYITQKIKEFEVLTPMTFALKTILQKAFLNDPYKGGLSSYGVVLLIIHFLSVQIKRGNDVSIKNLGKLFYDILYYYGYEYDLVNPIIIDENADYQKISFFHQFQLLRNEFILVDPLNITNNVAKNTRQYKNIILAFKIGYFSFFESCECGCHYQYDGINIKEEGCKHNLLQRIFNDVKRES